jgi:hypothetical protein
MNVPLLNHVSSQAIIEGLLVHASPTWRTRIEKARKSKMEEEQKIKVESYSQA